MAITTPILQLGDFDFLGFEEPESVTFGKEQSATKHMLIGGGRVIDLLGAGDPDISWSGYFTGFQAEFRARFIENLVKAGKPLLLKTSQFVKNVVITRFTYGYHKVFPIAYSITLMVIEDKTLPVTFQVPGDITDTVLSALLEAMDIAILIADGSISSALALALIAAEEAAPFASASSASIAAALAAAQAAQVVIGTAIDTVEQKLFG